MMTEGVFFLKDDKGSRGRHLVNIYFGLWCLLLHFGTKICEGSPTYNNYSEGSVLHRPFEQRQHENFLIDINDKMGSFMLA